MTVRCRWLEETGTARVALRVYEDGPCPDARGYHDARVPLGEAPIARVDDEHGGHWGQPDIPPVADDDPRWPDACGCGHRFGDAARRQVFHEALYRFADTGEVVALTDAPPGAMWDAWWVPWKGPDGRSVEVVCPDGTRWQVDGVASNCTLHPSGTRTVGPYDPDPASGPEHHRCWIREGTPPELTVGKNGHTCAAGAGSIATSGYHGFLRGGVFTDG